MQRSVAIADKNRRVRGLCCLERKLPLPKKFRISKEKGGRGEHARDFVGFGDGVAHDLAGICAAIFLRRERSCRGRRRRRRGRREVY